MDAATTILEDLAEEEVELPAGWEVKVDGEGHVFYVDHNARTTTFVRPSASRSEEAEEQQNLQTGESGSLKWRNRQNEMIHRYLLSAQANVETKEKKLMVKQERLLVANDQINRLSMALVNCHRDRAVNNDQQLYAQSDDNQRSSSSFNLNSTAAFGSGSTSSLSAGSLDFACRYDPERLRVEINRAKKRLNRLKLEEQRATKDLLRNRMAVSNLNDLESRVTQTASQSSGGGGCLATRAVDEQLAAVQQTLAATRCERRALHRSVTRLQGEVAAYNNVLDRVRDEFGDAEITSSEVGKSKLADIAKARLKLAEVNSHYDKLQQQLASVYSMINPTDFAVDEERLELLWEKEHLLRELKSLRMVDEPTEQKERVRANIAALERDLVAALQVTPPELEKRLKIYERYRQLCDSLVDCSQEKVNLATRLRNLSASALSSCSSLDDASSVGSSLNELASFPVPIVGHATNLGGLKELRQRVGQLVSVGVADDEPSEGPIEQSTADCLVAAAVGENSAKTAGTSTGVAVAASSEESLAGDSGVFDQSPVNPFPPDREQNLPVACGDYLEAAEATHLPPPPQLQIRLEYDFSAAVLNVFIDRGRQFLRLPSMAAASAVRIQGILLPVEKGEFLQFDTDYRTDIDMPVFLQHFSLPIRLPHVQHKVLQLYVRKEPNSGPSRGCVGGAQVNLAEFNRLMARSQWVNLLGPAMWPVWPSAQSLLDTAQGQLLEQVNVFADPQYLKLKECGQDEITPSLRSATIECRPACAPVIREESSDESTVISSQTSTLTRPRDDGARQQQKGWAVQKCSSTEGISRVVVRTAADNGVVALNCATAFGEEKTGRKSSFEARKEEYFAADRGEIGMLGRLNRSESDSSVPTPHGSVCAAAVDSAPSPFSRTAMERRSLRTKVRQPPTRLFGGKSASSAVQKAVVARRHRQLRTATDAEVELQSARFELLSEQEEVNALRKAKAELVVQKRLAAGERSTGLVGGVEMNVASQQQHQRKKVERYMKKALNTAHNPRHVDPANLSFQQKMCVFLNPR